VAQRGVAKRRRALGDVTNRLLPAPSCPPASDTSSGRGSSSASDAVCAPPPSPPFRTRPLLARFSPASRPLLARFSPASRPLLASDACATTAGGGFPPVTPPVIQQQHALLLLVVVRGLLWLGTPSPPCPLCAAARGDSAPHGRSIDSFVCDVMLPAGCCLPHTIYQRHIHVSCARSRPAGTPPSLPS
jgi:hypothetical protein